MVGMCRRRRLLVLLSTVLLSFGLDGFCVSAPSVLRTAKTIAAPDKRAEGQVGALLALWA